ncbi:uncharacterized protein CIMG_06739 [Coccidioides immitis RS]|uniref:Uncharacterized protein n=1 Tax=Coccidioides immitis (strain RS) TaxID=246410 RepID=J3K8T2_COCIM|nr:uncharacterized protein CIMG_06739 [Coccidioides immitis RS]EAS31260.3 hypothetical protein CIMG_06739 [Coccidioides immitis RS]
MTRKPFDEAEQQSPLLVANLDIIGYDLDHIRAAKRFKSFLEAGRLAFLRYPKLMDANKSTLLTYHCSGMAGIKPQKP